MKNYRVTWKEHRVESFTNVIPAESRQDAERKILVNYAGYRIEVDADESDLDCNYPDPIWITDVQEEL